MRRWTCMGLLVSNGFSALSRGRSRPAGRVLAAPRARSASSLFGAGEAVLRPVAYSQASAARGRGQGTEMLAELGGWPPLAELVFRSALTPEHAEGG
jgi:hypothetical protein